MPPPRFSVRDVQFSQELTGYIITVTSDTPCHLFMRWTTEQPRTHVDPKWKRGYPFPAKIRFCFVVYKDNEQEEVGDTLEHTFLKLDWPHCQTRYFYFWGTINGEVSPSESPLFEKHFTKPMAAYLYLERALLETCWFNGVDVSWNAVHDALSYPLSESGSLLYAWTRKVDDTTWWNRRIILRFNTEAIPADAVIWSARLDIRPTYKYDRGNYNICFVPATGVGDEALVGDYGEILNDVADVCDRLFIDDIVINTWYHRELNALGIAQITPGGWTKFAIKTQIDVDDVEPLTGVREARLNIEANLAGGVPTLAIAYTLP